MADKSAFFDLILPGKGEYRDAWWGPVNSNFETLDTWGSSIDGEIAAARFSMTSLSAFLAAGHDVYGITLPTPEILAAQISPIYGFQTPEPALFDLTTRIAQVEWEMWYSREAQDNLRKNLAFRTLGIKNQILDGTKDADGYPTWLGYTGAIAHIDGSVTPIWFAIDGRLGRVRTLANVTIPAGGSGIRYLYSQYLEDSDIGKIVVDGQLPSPLGVTSFDVNNYPIYFSDTTKDFTALDVKVGDILTLIDSADKGSYVVKTVAPSSTTNMLEIIGQFPTGGISGINYTIVDPLKTSLGVDTSESPATGKIYIGELDFDGAAVTAVRPRHFGDTFISEWRAIDVGTITTFEEVFDHCLGSLELDISVQVSQADDGSLPIEELSLTTITRNLGLTLNSTGLTLTKTADPVFDEGVLPTFSQGVDTPPTPANGFSQGIDSFSRGTSPSLTGATTYSLSGNVTGSITGDVAPDSSVRMQWTKNQLWIKNAESGKFYKGYSGTVTQTGFVRVIVRKRG
jgi:hypothetical protein